MAKRLKKFDERCQQIEDCALNRFPERIKFIRDSGDVATPHDLAAAEVCCCPLCMNEHLERHTEPSVKCSVCQRRCCQICSNVRDGKVVCISKTCAILCDERKLSSQEMFLTCVRTCKHLLCQWLVLQEKKERSLGPLRALVLKDAQYAAEKALELQK
jgi:hypothetical protein